MTQVTDSLPNDLQTLKALVSAQRAEIERLTMMIAKFRRTQFGRSSEQLDAMIDQLQLSLEEQEVRQGEVMPITDPAPRAVSRRKPLPEHLPREIHVHQPESQCSGCGGTLRQLGEDVSEVLEYVPARFKVIRHVRPKLVCRCCEHIAQVPAPSTGKTKTARLWTYVRDDRPAGYTTPAAVWFAYSPDRKGQHPRAHLKNFSGILQADGYAGFAQLYSSGSVQEAACWAHARRKFYDVYKDQSSPLAGEVLQRVAALYVIESEIRGQPPDLRKAVRQSRACPLLEQLHTWPNHTATADGSKSTTTLPNARCAPSLWVAKIICLWAPIPVESEPLQFTAW